jgi:hypothetical protein
MLGLVSVPFCDHAPKFAETAVSVQHNAYRTHMQEGLYRYGRRCGRLDTL